VLALAMLVASAGWAQSSSGYFSKVTAKLGENETRGKGLFLQRCSICHLPQLPGRKPPVGPALSGYLQSPTPEKQAAARQKIVDGSPAMPGFRYALQSKDVDDIIAYLKTF
jgi:mono/diheme cytochrome c family protein